MKRRLAIFLLSTLAGICVGLTGDFLAPDPVHARDVLVSVLLSPVVITFGGKSVTIKAASGIFLAGGLAFIPIYIAFLWLCIRRTVSWVYLATFLWCAQGYFQVVHRLWAVMSV